jgi:hypothetical protein
MSELMKSGKVGNNTTDEEIFNAWKDSGLLERLAPVMRIKVAKALENGAKLLLTGKYKDVEWDFDMVLFPVIRRCMTGIEDYGVDKITGKNVPLDEAEVKKAIILHNFDVILVADMLYKNYTNLETIYKDLYCEYLDKI